MTDLRAYQPSFTAGELSPALWARVDLSKYGSGLKTALNRPDLLKETTHKGEIIEAPDDAWL